MTALDARSLATRDAEARHAQDLRATAQQLRADRDQRRASDGDPIVLPLLLARARVRAGRRPRTGPRRGSGTRSQRPTIRSPTTTRSSSTRNPGMAITNTPFFGRSEIPGKVNGQPITQRSAAQVAAQPVAVRPGRTGNAAPPLSAASLQSIRGWSHADAQILAAGGTVPWRHRQPDRHRKLRDGGRGERDGSHGSQQLPDAPGVHR